MTPISQEQDLAELAAKEAKELTFKPQLIARSFKFEDTNNNECTSNGIINRTNGGLAKMLREPTSVYVKRIKEMSRRREEMAKKMIQEKEVL